MAFKIVIPYYFSLAIQCSREKTNLHCLLALDFLLLEIKTLYFEIVERKKEMLRRLFFLEFVYENVTLAFFLDVVIL